MVENYCIINACTHTGKILILRFCKMPHLDNQYHIDTGFVDYGLNSIISFLHRFLYIYYGTPSGFICINNILSTYLCTRIKKYVSLTLNGDS